MLPRCVRCGEQFVMGGRFRSCPDCRRPLPDQRMALDRAWEPNWEGVRIEVGFAMLEGRAESLRFGRDRYREVEMPRGATSREQAQPKIDYRRWMEFRVEVERLRDAGMSWTQISKAAKKDNNGWAANAYEHRGLVVDKDVEILRALETPALVTDKEEEEMPRRAKVTRMCTPDEAKEFRALAKALNESGRVQDDIARMAGYSAGANISKVMTGSREPSFDRLQQLRAAVAKEYGQKRYEWLVAGAFQKPVAQQIEEMKHGEVLKTPEGDVVEMTDRREESRGVAEVAKQIGGWTDISDGTQPSSAMVPREHEVKPDPWAWLDEVYEGLFKLAVLVDEHEGEFLSLVPESFRDAMRGPFREKREVIERAMDEFRR